MGIQNEKGYHSLYAVKFLMIFLSFSDFLAHLSRRLMVSFCDQSLSGVSRPPTFLSTTSPKLLAQI